RIFNKRKWLILSLAVAFLALGAVGTLMVTPLYTATVRLQIDRNVTKVVEGGNVTPIEGADVEFLRTQYELLQSRSMAERVASALKLGNDADFLRPRDFSVSAAISRLLALGAPPKSNAQAPDKAALERQAAGVVMGNRAVHPLPGSRLVDINYSDPV